MKIICLNLKRATERKALIEKEWIEKRGFYIDFFEGYDKLEIEKRKYIFPYNEVETIKRIGRPLSSGEIACATSHCLILKQALDNNIDELVILEDDCLPTENCTPESLTTTISICKQTYPFVNVLILHQVNSFTKYIESKNGINLIAFPPFGNLMVWFNRKAMQQLFTDLSTMYYPADWLWYKRFTPLKTIASAELPFGYTTNNDSFIGAELRGKHIS